MLARNVTTIRFFLTPRASKIRYFPDRLLVPKEKWRQCSRRWPNKASDAPNLLHCICRLLMLWTASTGTQVPWMWGC
jgi:hypothetical protein